MMDPQTKSIVHSRDVQWLTRMYFPTRGTPGVTVPIQQHGSVKPTEDGSVDSSDSNDSESVSSAGKRKKQSKQLDKPSDSIDSKSIDSYDTNESFRSEDMDYTQEDGTQLDPYHQGPLVQEHEFRFQSDSESEDELEGGITRSGAQYLMLAMEIAAMNLEDEYTEGTC